MPEPITRERFREKWGGGPLEARQEFDADLDALRAAERERCAIVCDEIDYDYRGGAWDAARKIRGLT